MLSLPILAKMSSAALAAGITACLTYGQYNVTSGPKGAGLMPPAIMLHPNARADAMLDPLYEVTAAMMTLKQERAKADRNRAMIAWLASLRAGFTVQRLESGLVYKVRYVPEVDVATVLEDYVAIPFGTEMPFAVRLHASGDGAVRIEGLSCKDQIELGNVDAAAGGAAAQAAAMAQAEAYLRKPDAAEPDLAADCLMLRLRRN